mmetsp:Transcript_8882/g.15397  ORF Transcript_8882/g.15397 Transcript_8882/m.15397 type:complete len:84 (-) Transcript_8882:71-322(-)|eukprot:CAMPEP_0119109130 /NCGR_PEP_ID=MMETSP1180-20130426/17344_1 /TAXON_ID=3052 ORGANISM="Chlamydomonas cf sp, Strain CCMP681" /NCGR_SAMPLE_ID=MMETSP1180 /ASSEMBLY_ACC=CAM_ASM_000741 /LENGTH=83 /DNA_ID=CAMNT_0007094843 /DNA_START=1107 /DNA_END=1358 /DNA_ORIENTATION=-
MPLTLISIRTGLETVEPEGRESLTSANALGATSKLAAASVQAAMHASDLKALQLDSGRVRVAGWPMGDLWCRLICGVVVFCIL